MRCAQAHRLIWVLLVIGSFLLVNFTRTSFAFISQPTLRSRLCCIASRSTTSGRAPPETGSGIPVFDLQEAPSEKLYRQVCEACEDIGFFCIKGHGVPEEIFENVRLASRKAVFDRPVSEKKNLAVKGMQLSRGWEMSPQHREYMHSLLSSRPFLVAQQHPEISAEEGIMTERFCIGPEVTLPFLHLPPFLHATSVCTIRLPPIPQIAAAAGGGGVEEWAGTAEEDAVFLHPNVWPDGPDGARLRAAMADCYRHMEAVSEVPWRTSPPASQPPTHPRTHAPTPIFQLSFRAPPGFPRRGADLLTPRAASATPPLVAALSLRRAWCASARRAGGGRAGGCALQADGF